MRMLCELLGITQSMSHADARGRTDIRNPFYSQFKVDLGDPNRFETLGELVYEIYRLLHVYNTSRIHTALKMPPQTYALRYQTTQFLMASNVS